jgi:phospholipase C
MESKSHLRKWRLRATLSASLATLLAFPIPASAQNRSTDDDNDHSRTQTPIKHVIVLIGENRAFDHIFATYVPKSEDSVSNLLSKGIINADGTPGKHFDKAAQFQAVPPFSTKFFISLDNGEKAPYQILPVPTLNTAPNATTFPPGTPPNFLAAI